MTTENKMLTPKEFQESMLKQFPRYVSDKGGEMTIQERDEIAEAEENARISGCPLCVTHGVTLRQELGELAKRIELRAYDLESRKRRKSFLVDPDDC